MQLIQAIALLCQMSGGSLTKDVTAPKYQTQCVQSYLNCVSKRRGTMSEKSALERCILEK